MMIEGKKVHPAPLKPLHHKLLPLQSVTSSTMIAEIYGGDMFQSYVLLFLRSNGILSFYHNDQQRDRFIPRAFQFCIQ
jgi:hypothetical protein